MQEELASAEKQWREETDLQKQQIKDSYNQRCLEM
jgi:hypothetical protein